MRWKQKIGALSFSGLDYLSSFREKYLWRKKCFNFTNTGGWFHQTLCAKQKDASAQRLEKYLPLNFTKNWNSKFQAKIGALFAKFIRRAPKNASHYVRAKKSGAHGRKFWWNRPRKNKRKTVFLNRCAVDFY